MLSAADNALVARDGRIPALGVLLDPDAATAMLTRLYPEAAVESVAPRYVRYKRGTSCLVAFVVRTSAGAVDVYARAHNPNLNNKAEHVDDEGAVAPVLGGGIRVVPESALIVFPFPNDHELPALRELEAATSREAMLRDALPTEVRLWSGQLEAVRYKPERRFVARLRTDAEGDAGDEPGSGAALKFYRRSDYQSVRDMTGVFRSVGPLRVPRRIDRSKRYHLAAVEWLDGVPLRDALTSGNAPDVAEGAWRTVGAALAELHIQKSSKLIARHTAETYVGSLREAATAVGEVAPALAGRAEAIAERIGAKLLKRHWRTRRAIHGDFSSEQVVLLPDAAAVLDFDRASYGDPRIDLGTFAARLAYDVVLGAIDEGVATACADSVLDAYREASEKDITRKVDRFTAASLLLMAVEPFRHRVPDWHERIDAVLGRAETLISGERTGAA